MDRVPCLRASMALMLVAGLALVSGCQTTSPTGGDSGLRAPGLDTLLCARDAKPEPKWFDRSVGYEIFVRSFQDSDGDGVGDLRGLMSRLDYLNDGDPETTDDLGVDLLWLMPIFHSPSYHGYDVIDYRRVNPEYGTEEDLRALLEAAHARGIRVIVDLVANHTSNRNLWFVRAALGEDRPERNWYVWRQGDPGWTKPWDSSLTWHRKRTGWYYGLFVDAMPDLNYLHPPVREEMKDIALHWLGLGLDGYRLDAVRYLVETGGGDGQQDTPETHAYWRELRRELDAKFPDAMVVGEAWAETAISNTYYGAPDDREMHMLFDFDGAYGMVGAVKDSTSVSLTKKWCERWAATPSFGTVGTFLRNHDQPRLGTEFAEGGKAAQLTAAALLMFGPGTPWMYYGEELGLPNGGALGDTGYRLPMPWSTEMPGVGFSSGEPWYLLDAPDPSMTIDGQRSAAGSTLDGYRRLIRIRRAHPALQIGASELHRVPDFGSKALALHRRAADDVVAAVVYVGRDQASGEVALPVELRGLNEVVDEWSGRRLPVRDGRIQWTIDGPGFLLLSKGT